MYLIIDYENYLIDKNKKKLYLDENKNQIHFDVDFEVINN